MMRTNWLRLAILMLAVIVTGSAAYAAYHEPGPADLKPLEGKVTEGFRLTAELYRPVVAPGDAVFLRLTLKNVSDSPLWLMDSNTDNDYPLVIVDPDGKVLSRPFPSLGAYRNVEMMMHPGESQVKNYRVDKLYDLSPVGKYRIVAYRVAPEFGSDWKKWSKVVSNAVELTVQPKTAASTGAAPDGMTPFRAALERQGYSVVWLPKSRTALVRGHGVVATIQSGSSTLVVNGQGRDMGKPARIVHDVLYVPEGLLRLLAPNT